MTDARNATVPAVRSYIAGEFVDTVATDVWLEDPSTGERIQQMRRTGDDDVERALAAAWEAHQSGVWSSTTVAERAAKLREMQAALEPMAMEAARLESLTTGVTISLTGMLSVIFHGAFGLAADAIESGILRADSQGMAGQDVEVHRLPLGPALNLVPWNAPAPMAAHKIASSLAAGAPTILKPTEYAPNACGLIAEAAHAVGLPAGVLQIVHGGPDVGGRLVNDDRIAAVSFTGGLGGGRAIGTACADQFKPAQLELGGNNPLLIMPDADANNVAMHVVNLMTQLNGQWCRALGRLVLPAARADEILEVVLAALAKVQLGDALSTDSQMGPLIHSNHLATVKGQLDALVAAGGTVHAPATLPDGGGNFMSPTLVTGITSADMQDEIFGPVAAVLTYDTVAEGIALANDVPHGLEAYVCGADVPAALEAARKVRAGEVKVNGSTVLSLSMMTPRPAWGVSGTGVEGTNETIEFFTGLQVVGVEVLPDFMLQG